MEATKQRELPTKSGVRDGVEDLEEDLIVEELLECCSTSEVKASNALPTISPSGMTTEGKPNSKASRIVLDLSEALGSTQLDKLLDVALTWCKEQGAVCIFEVVEYFEEFADALDLKKLERKRLLRYLEGMTLSNATNSLPNHQDCPLDSIDMLMRKTPSSLSASSSCTSTSASSGQVPLGKPGCKMAWSAKQPLEKGNDVKSNIKTCMSSYRGYPNASKLSESATNLPETVNCKSIIYQCAIFEGLSELALDAVFRVLEAQPIAEEGNVVFLHGSDAQAMFFVISGEVEIRSQGGSVLATIREEGFFGEIGVLFAGQRTASAIVSKGPCKLAKLKRSELVKVALAHGFQDALFDRGQSLMSVRTWFVKRLPLFSGCIDEPGFLDKVASALVVQKFKAGETLIREGEDGSEMYFIFDGTVTVTKRRASGAPIRLNSPHFFGELALLFAEPRSATVACAVQCRLYILAREKLHAILQEHPKAIGAIYSTAKEADSLKAYFIRKIPLFQSMSSNEEFVANVSMALESCSAEPGEFLVRQGQASDGRMFAIAHGNAEVLKVKKAGLAGSVVATLNAGSFFGEVALLLDTPRMASVVARGHCHMYTLSRDAFETLAVVYEDWWKNLMSEQGALMKQVKDSGVGIATSTRTRTHGLQIPEVRGISVSSMLCAAEEPEDVNCSIPENRICLVCRTDEKAMLSVPCGHISACVSCHEALTTCPICRGSIAGGHRAFF